MPRSLWEYMRDQFIGLELGFILVAEYEARFYELAKYTYMILLTEYEQI